MDMLRIILFLAVGVFGIFFGARSGGNLYIYGGILLLLIGAFNGYVAWKQSKEK
ncbi:MAG: hypothetical protein JEY99_09595 [Spirochaetales bacterium]|nr:hypothetical protein [Spirochaetales bacterium]